MFQSARAVRQSVEEGFGGRRILVAGDLMLDTYLWGDVERISPEAPVPVVRLTRRTETPGGAANVALNLAALGLQVTALGFLGRDAAGQHLLDMLEAAGVEARAAFAADDRPTTSKTRVLGGIQHLLRIDEEIRDPLTLADQDELIERCTTELDRGAHGIILSDYGKGVVTERVCKALIAEARRRGLPILIDPKGQDFRKYAGAHVLTPNLLEFERAACNGSVAGADLHSLASQLRVQLGLDLLVLTRAERGVSLFDARGQQDIPTAARAVTDVSGAGDTLIAVLAGGLAAGLNAADAVQLGNLAAGIAVGCAGTSVVSQNMLLERIAELLWVNNSEMKNIEQLTNVI